MSFRPMSDTYIQSRVPTDFMIGDIVVSDRDFAVAGFASTLKGEVVEIKKSMIHVLWDNGCYQITQCSALHITFRPDPQDADTEAIVEAAELTRQIDENTELRLRMDIMSAEYKVEYKAGNRLWDRRAKILRRLNAMETEMFNKLVGN